MNNTIKEDIAELERLKKEIPKDEGSGMAVIYYKQYLNLFYTTLKVSVDNGSITEGEAAELKRKYQEYWK